MNKDRSLKCRGWGELCTADPNFSFAFVNSKLEDGELVSVLYNRENIPV